MKVNVIKILAFVLILAGGLSSCQTKSPDTLEAENKSDDANEIWECVLVDLDIIITLSLDANTKLVSISKSPEEIGDNDQYHQFRNGDQYILQNDTLHFKDLDGTICFTTSCSFAITTLSENEMELKYLGFILHQPLHKNIYLFNRKFD
ncbi:MAG: hypothetical protein FWH18_12315 [Marinilabiliaceae bacterium]|nr:hypothetical protein [Marinilabiliaceae bacterium]